MYDFEVNNNRFSVPYFLVAMIVFIVHINTNLSYIHYLYEFYNLLGLFNYK